MPSEGKRWRHVIVNTRGSWLPGDPRGFRNRGHRIHSSGDYKHRPPVGEHAGLFRYNSQRAVPAVKLPASARALVGRAFLKRLKVEGHQVLVVSVSAMHVHLLAELPEDRGQAKLTIGRCKRAACDAVKSQISGRIWSAGGEYRLIRDRAHQVNAFHYIREQQGEGAWVWTFKESPP